MNGSCNLTTLSLAVHSMPGETFAPDTVGQQKLLDSTTGPGYRSGRYTITVDLPDGNEDDG